MYGVTRSAAKADGLAAAEIVPLVVEDINNTDAYIGAIGEADVIVNCASDYVRAGARALPRPPPIAY